MNIFEFDAKILGDTIKIPDQYRDMAAQFDGKFVRVIVCPVDLDSKEDIDFQQAAISNFLKGYHDADSAYDNFEFE